MPGWQAIGPHAARGKPLPLFRGLGPLSGAWQMFTLCPWVGAAVPGTVWTEGGIH